MAATICPTITAESSDQFSEQIARIGTLSSRLHIDVADGEFTPRKLLGIPDIWWPGGVRADIHVMFARPFLHLETLIRLAPQLIICHAESEGDFGLFADTVHAHGIEAGVALLPQTPVSAIEAGLTFIDHVLIFSGNLGYQGGSQADMSLLAKVEKLKKLKPTVEVGWDGGINEQNVVRLAAAGVDVLNVGGFIQTSNEPAKAYATLKKIIAPRRINIV